MLKSPIEHAQEHQPELDRNSLATVEHVATLDGLRGVAAAAIVFYHIAGKTHFPHAFLAVDFFFLLSGFVISKAYSDRLIEGTMTFFRFLVVRIVRLYPLVFLGVLLGAADWAVIERPTQIALFMSATGSALLLLPTSSLLSPAHPMLWPINVPHWSLFFELVINLVFALLARVLTMPTLVAVCVLSAFGLCAVAVTNQGVDVGSWPANFFFGFIRVTFSFSVGVLLQRHHPKWRLSTIATPALIASLIAILLCPYFGKMWAYDLAAIMLAFPIIVVLGANSSNYKQGSRILLGVGTISYSLYATQLPIMHFTQVGLQHLQLRQNSVVGLVIQVLATMLFSIAALKLWDEPIRRFLSRLASPPARPIGSRA